MLPTLQNAAADQGVYSSSLIQQILDTSNSCKLELFKFLDKHGKELKCPNIWTQKNPIKILIFYLVVFLFP